VTCRIWRVRACFTHRFGGLVGEVADAPICDKLYNVDPETHLRLVLARIADHAIDGVGELMTCAVADLIPEPTSLLDSVSRPRVIAYVMSGRCCYSATDLMCMAVVARCQFGRPLLAGKSPIVPGRPQNPRRRAVADPDEPLDRRIGRTQTQLEATIHRSVGLFPLSAPCVSPPST
jgi:hypothetical protein